jgi:hypothetical protein
MSNAFETICINQLLMPPLGTRLAGFRSLEILHHLSVNFRTSAAQPSGF